MFRLELIENNKELGYLLYENDKEVARVTINNENTCNEVWGAEAFLIRKARIKKMKSGETIDNNFNPHLKIRNVDDVMIKRLISRKICDNTKVKGLVIPLLDHNKICLLVWCTSDYYQHSMDTDHV